MKAYFVITETNRNRIVEAVKRADIGDAVKIGEATRTLEQNALIHAVLSEVGKKLNWKWAGQKVDIDDLKSIFMAAYRKAAGTSVRFAVGLDGQPVILNWRTRDLTKRECSEFVEMVNAWLATQECA